MKKIFVIASILMLAGCTFGGSVNADGGSNGVGIGLGIGTGIRF
ncbi:hypothetical protein [Glaesserella parasuis]|nr:hypothetical protein [Glaesserella parasuis]MDG6245427.1 hypothetical protein [Glaesserella parasuis]MDG6275374.1 hypothetical protein [Glaesserella parasuis]MDG6328413.1 hypothetical protein [Glaesserella parasuis]MDG6458312.1 hypothetical protein [Glaesserella parasuis]MDG6874940.1 hypothetical protein [Glaesserella parasuis]